MQWPPDFAAEDKRRALSRQIIVSTPNPRETAHEYYSNNPVAFINDNCITYDPRNPAKGLPAKMPFIMFPKQEELVMWLLDNLNDEEDGLIEKSRDMGATWVCSAFSVWLWLYVKGSAVGWGSRKEMLVDRIGDPDSIFEKIRMIIRNLPAYLLPEDFEEKDSFTFMKCINHTNESNIAGEGGDNIGRGGRKSIYFKDEALKMSANVLTPGGWVKNGDLRVGQAVVGVDGLPTEVTQIKDFNSVKMFRINFSDGTSCDASPNHLWTVDKVVGKREQLTLNTTSIFNNYKYTSPGGQTLYRYRVPLCSPVQFEDRGELPLHPYIVGALLGDGSVGCVPKGCPRITSIDPEIISNIEKWLPDGVVLSQDKTKTIDYRVIDVDHLRGKNNRARVAIVAAGIAGKRSWEKFIPDTYKYSSPKDRLLLLQGLMDTDGSASSEAVTFHSSSKQLAMDTRFLVQSLGGVAFYRVSPNASGFRDMHILNISMPSNLSAFKLTRKIERVHRKQRLAKTIVEVTQTAPAAARCISVDAPDGLYIVDGFIVTHNSAHYDRPELIEASLGDNTNVQIDISSVNGEGNVFHRKRIGGIAKVFILDWRDHPAKTQAWYDKRKLKAESEGLTAEFAQEVDRDYSSAVEGILIPSEYAKACLDAHIVLGIDPEGTKRAGLDVADEGGDKNALIAAHGVVVNHIDQWGKGDTDYTAKKAYNYATSNSIDELTYDSIGVGAGVKGTFAAIARETEEELSVLVRGFAAGGKVVDPEFEYTKDKKNKDMFVNVKAQGWWKIHDMCLKTYQAVVEGKDIDPSEILSISSACPLANELISELSRPKKQYDNAGKMKVESKKDMKKRGMPSPNLADALIMVYAPHKQTASPSVRVL